MNVRHSRLARLVALTVVGAMPLVGMAGVASAAKVKASPKACIKHPHKAGCAKGNSGGGAGGATGGATPPNIIVSVSPNPVQEVGQSEIDVIIQVETLPIFANQTVDISSQQLFLSCLSLSWKSSASNTPSHVIGIAAGITGVILDNDGNATVELQGMDCAPGQNLIEADLAGAPYTTATATLTASPPGVTAFPTITGAPNPEVETGDNGPGNSESQVYANFLIEENPVYAEQIVNVTSAQLTNRCELGRTLWSSTAGVGGGGALLGTTGVTAVLDNDGNATVELQGEDCAPGANLVEADLGAAPYTTATATLTAAPPGVTVFPTITGAPNPEVETGDGAPANSESQVYADFLIEENPVYAEQIVDVTSAQLTNRCEFGKTLWSSTPGVGGGGTLIGNIGVTAVLDNDGNAVVTFEGISCAAGTSLVDGELVGGTHDTFTNNYLIKPPAVTDI